MIDVHSNGTKHLSRSEKLSLWTIVMSKESVLGFNIREKGTIIH